MLPFVADALQSDPAPPTPYPVAECNGDSSGGVTSMEAKIDTATQNLDALSSS
jgi:hypothetical protein